MSWITDRLNEPTSRALIGVALGQVSTWAASGSTDWKVLIGGLAATAIGVLVPEAKAMIAASPTAASLAPIVSDVAKQAAPAIEKAVGATGAQIVEGVVSDMTAPQQRPAG